MRKSAARQPGPGSSGYDRNRRCVADSHDRLHLVRIGRQHHQPGDFAIAGQAVHLVSAPLRLVKDDVVFADLGHDGVDDSVSDHQDLLIPESDMAARSVKDRNALVLSAKSGWTRTGKPLPSMCARDGSHR